MKHLIYYLLLALFVISCSKEKQVAKIPIIYCTDLYQPPQDPDDHYDLAILACLPEFDVRAIIFDNATDWRDATKEAGIGALQQISDISKSPIPPYAIGLREKLTSLDDKAENQPEETQKGVELIIKTLRESNEKVVLFLVGSCRDFAVAFNREPDLLREKVKALYVNAGNGPDGLQFEWNVMLDSYSYMALMQSGLPIYWAPCFSQVNLRQATPEDILNGDISTYNTYYIAPNQAELLKPASDKLKNFFAYALNREQGEPVSFLYQPAQALPQRGRNMWCTAVFYHAAGRQIYLHNGEYQVYSPQKANELNVAGNEISVYQFQPVEIKAEMIEGEIIFTGDLNVSQSNIKVFQYINPEYNNIMTSTLSALLGEL